MQIQPDLLEGHAVLRKASQAVFKEAAIVRFEMDFPIFRQNLLESFQEGLVGQTALFMALLGPGIRKVQIETVNLRIRKIVGQTGTIYSQELDIGQTTGQNLV